MNKTQKQFFHKPRTVEEVMNKLFKGDAWAANDFQNKQCEAGVLEPCLVDHPNGKEYAQQQGFKLQSK